TDDRLLLCRACANQIADNHQPGGDPDVRLQLDGFDIKATDNVDGAQPRPNRPLGIVLVRLRIAEINQHAVAHIPTDEAIEPGDSPRRGGGGGAPPPDWASAGKEQSSSSRAPKPVSPPTGVGRGGRTASPTAIWRLLEMTATTAEKKAISPPCRWGDP